MLKNQRWRLGAALWLAAMAGVVILSVSVIPQVLAKTPQPVSGNVAIALSIVQSGLLVALAVWAGVALARPLGLGAPAIEALVAGANPWSALKRQFAPAAIVGLLVAGLLLFLSSIAPAQLQALGHAYEIPLSAKLLYGGVTEEVLMRWGLMTLIVWLPWRYLQKRQGAPRPAYVIVAILTSALLFGAGHLPAAVAMGAELDAAVLTYVLVGNALPGVMLGILYWRWGLEAAIVAHALGHAVSSLVVLA